MLPMYPAPPVTRMLRAIARFQAKQALQGFEEAVTPAGARSLLQSDGGLVQELVEQRVTEVLELRAILQSQVHAAQRPLQLVRSDALHAVA